MEAQESGQELKTAVDYAGIMSTNYTERGATPGAVWYLSLECTVEEAPKPP